MFISLWLLVGTLVLSPLFLVLSPLFDQSIEMYQGFGTIAMTGLGLMFLPAVLWLSKLIKKATIIVISWHAYTLKGGR
nr:DUF1700 domain-containing protein [Listeria fleischmannii]